MTKAIPDGRDQVHSSHPIDYDIVCRISYDNGVPPRVLDGLLERCSKAWDEDREMLSWAVQQFHITGLEIMVDTVNDELMIIDGLFFTVTHLMQKFGTRGAALEFDVSLVNLAIMAQKAHTEQADRIRDHQPLVDEEEAYPVVMYRPGHGPRD